MCHLHRWRIRVGVTSDRLNSEALQLDDDLFAKLAGTEKQGALCVGFEGRSDASHGCVARRHAPSAVVAQIAEHRYTRRTSNGREIFADPAGSRRQLSPLMRPFGLWRVRDCARVPRCCSALSTHVGVDTQKRARSLASLQT